MTTNNLEKAGQIARQFNAWARDVVRSGSEMGENLQEAMGLPGRSFVLVAERFARQSGDPLDHLHASVGYAEGFARAGYDLKIIGNRFLERNPAITDAPEVARKLHREDVTAFKALFGS